MHRSWVERPGRADSWGVTAEMPSACFARAPVLAAEDRWPICAAGKMQEIRGAGPLAGSRLGADSFSSSGEAVPTRAARQLFAGPLRHAPRPIAVEGGAARAGTSVLERPEFRLCAVRLDGTSRSDQEGNSGLPHTGFGMQARAAAAHLQLRERDRRTHG
eukprot:6381425-Prymnesium_polylepis.1